MDSSGRIYPPEAVKAIHAKAVSRDEGAPSALRKFKQLVALDEGLAQRLRAMNRSGRRAWYSRYRHEQKIARKQGRPAAPPNLID